MPSELLYTIDTHCLNCGHWFPIIENSSFCPRCFSKYIRIVKIIIEAGYERPLSAIDMTERFKDLY